MSAVLTPADISAILAGTRNRGGHERNIRKFIDSGELYMDASALSEYKTKDAQILRNTLTQVAKKAQLGNVRFVKHEGSCLMINTELVPSDEAEGEDSPEA